MAELSQATREVNGISILRFSRNTLRLIISALRAVLNAAVEDGIVDNNAASKVGKFAKTEKPARQASAMTRRETEEFLATVREVRPRWYPFFLTALRAGLRKGELIALKWGDIHFGDSANDQTGTFSCSGAITKAASPHQRETGRGELISQDTCVASCWNCATSECSRPPLQDGRASQRISCLRRRPEP